jgi:hypothetical protein
MRASLDIAGTTLSHIFPSGFLVHAFGGGERSLATIQVRVAVEEFPDWVDLIALGVLFGQGAIPISYKKLRAWINAKL